MDHLEVIHRILAYHRVMRANLRKAGEAVPDRRAMFDLARQSTHWLPGKPQMLAERQKQLTESLEVLDQGLQRHFSFEEQNLSALWGELLMRALLTDHHRIMTELANLKTAVANVKLEELMPDRYDRQELRHELPRYLDELVSKQAHIHDRIEMLREIIEEHARKEEVILKWLEKVLEAEKETQPKHRAEPEKAGSA